MTRAVAPALLVALSAGFAFAPAVTALAFAIALLGAVIAWLGALIAGE